MMPDLSPLLWPVAGAAALILFTGFFIGWGWAGGLLLAFAALFVVFVIVVLSNTRFL